MCIRDRRSSGEIQIEALIEPYLAVEPLLHEHAREPDIDAAALVYSTLRLPECIDKVRLLLLGQSHEVFAQQGLSLIHISMLARSRIASLMRLMLYLKALSQESIRE